MCVQLLRSAGAILLQREIPEAVNLEVAKVCSVTHGCHAPYYAGISILPLLGLDPRTM